MPTQSEQCDAIYTAQSENDNYSYNSTTDTTATTDTDDDSINSNLPNEFLHQMEDIDISTVQVISKEEERDDGDNEVLGTNSKIDQALSLMKSVMNVNLVLYFILGVVSDLDVGYVQTPGFQQYIIGPNFNAAPGSVFLMLGMLLGGLLPTFVLIRFRPGVRIVITLLIQLMGTLFMWTLPLPFSNYLGTFFLYMGMVGTQITILPLTYYAGSSATIFYLAGQAIASFVGSALISLFDQLDLEETAHMIVLLCFPIISGLAFFSLDRSVFTMDENRNMNGNTQDIEIRDPNGGQDIECGCSNNTDIETEANISKQLSREESLAALKEIGMRYFPMLISWGLFMSLWSSSIANPSLQSSSLSYGGYDTHDSILEASDTITLVSSIVSTIVIVGSILSPLGNIISKQSPYFLWIPIGIMVVLSATGLLGICANAFPPMPVGVFYAASIAFSFCASGLNAYIPLFVGNDTILSKQYKEFQIQIAMSIFFLVQLVINSFGMFWFAGYVRNECIANYESNHEGVSCTYFSS